MPQTHKVLGQSNPSATTATTLYTAPSATSAIASTLVVANLSASAVTYRVAVRPAGATLANQHYIAYDASLPANDSAFLTLGITLAATDVVTVWASTANVAFSLYGVEIT
jgi:hypothetical protein